MIFVFSSDFVGKCSQPELCVVIETITTNRHLVLADGPTKKAIRQIVTEHAGTIAKERFQKSKIFDITEEQRQYLTTIHVDGHTSMQELTYHAGQKAMLVMENAYYEWPAYKRIIDAYSSDPIYGNMFKMLRHAKDRHLIDGVHLGGCGQLKSALKALEHNIGGRNLAVLKTCSLLDRDSDDPSKFSAKQRPNIEHLCGKSIDSVSNADIYDLNQDTHRWHMWYWNSIENYFPDRVYEEYGYDTSAIPPAPQRHWTKISDCFIGTKKSFKKSDVANLGATMNRKDYEQGLHKFDIGGKSVSELQLFLLKLVKLI